MINPATVRLKFAQYIPYIEVALLLIFCLLPLFLTYPYRVNIYLSWEGAYRLYLNQVPYRDFGMPTGYGYWIVPALFFKIFGPHMMSLVKAQVLINFVSGLAFISILKTMKLEQGWRLTALFFFCLTYLLINFWPWYNQSVFVYQLVSIAFLLKGFFYGKRYYYIYLVLAGLFTFLSFFTKQDGGGMAILVNVCLTFYLAISNKSYKKALIYIASLVITSLAIITPLLSYEFTYWFNYGQPPHYSRLSLHDITQVIFNDSQWLKFYIAAISVIYAYRIKNWANILAKPNETLFYLLTLGILVQASIVQVTSYTPPDNNIYYHSFAVAYLLYSLIQPTFIFTWAKLFVAIAAILLWWSGTYYKYVSRVSNRIFGVAAKPAESENIISLSTYAHSYDTSRVGVNLGEWKFLPNSKAFAGVYMPPETIEGIEKLRKLPLFESPNAKVLNMTELTPLAYELGFELERNSPLWYHVGVGMFEREELKFEQRVKAGYYDMVMFETIPLLNNFYPEALHSLLKQHYRLSDRFLAPRPQNNAFIEIYVRP